MDVIGAHAKRLPVLDERWETRPYPREELARALVAGGVAGPAGHPHDNVFGNVRMLVDLVHVRTLDATRSRRGRSE